MKISVVVPVYYNEGSLAQLHERLSLCAQQEAGATYEFVFVDDGSGDHSFQVLTMLNSRDPRVKVVKLVRNFGSTTAILAGLAHATGDVVAVISADLQDPPEMIPEMLTHWKSGTPMVFAARANREDPISTRLPAGVFNWAFRRFAFKNYPSGGFDCFLIDRKVVKVIIQCAEKNTHLPGLLMWSGFPHHIIYYERQKREHGKSRWNLSRKLKYFGDAFTAFSYFPLRLASTLGMIVALLGLLYAILIVTLTVVGGIQAEGWSSLMVVVLITSGLQMLMLGVVGEYLWRNFDQARHRPLFIVDRIIGEGPQTHPDTEELAPIHLTPHSYDAELAQPQAHGK
ncbi:MAG TPA: glycosyltransferase family 2 protein [Chloroflexia bacterium]|nr:glycosyltransferase family 2 protein [Chloroflexia bacterium]